MTTLDRYFKISDRHSTVSREVRGGLATFFTMAYIVVLNPLILGGAKDVSGAQLPLEQIASGTALVAAAMTLAMGIIGRYPFALAAGLGLNAVVAFQLASVMSWPAAMGVVVVEGLVISVLALTRLRQMVMDAVPMPLKHAIAVGIGLFIALIGFVDAGFVRRTGANPVPVEMGVAGQLRGWPTVVFVVGLLLAIVLFVRKVKGALLISIIATTIFAIIVNAVADVPAQFVPVDGAAPKITPTGWSLNVPRWPDKVFAMPDFGLLGHFSIGGSFAKVGIISALLFIFTLMLSDFFDTMGTVIGVGTEAGLVDNDGRLPGIQAVLLVDSLAAVAGGAASVSSNTTYIESAAGVGEGARTGLASVVTGGLFVLALFITPLVRIVPYEAASPVLVVVGFLMLTQVRHIPWSDYDIAIPAFLTMVLMPFTYSITNGIGAGFISYVVIKLARGRGRDVNLFLYIVAALFVLYFAIDPLQRLLGVG